jgi:leader peptidase (prepilin peptidase)/N-methyltransferase
MEWAADTAAAAALLGAAGGLLVPRLIAAVPEPDEPLEPLTPDEGPKEPYADIAAHPGLTWKAASASAVACGLIGLTVGREWALLFLLPLVPVSIALSVIDWHTRLLPTRMIRPTYAGLVALVVVCWLVTRDTDDVVRAGWGFVVAGVLFFILWFVHPRGMGFGDVRLSGILGIALGYLGWGPLLVGVYAGFLLGGVGGGLLSLLRIVERRAFPFGPFMIVGALVGIVAGDVIWSGLAPGLQ